MFAPGLRFRIGHPVAVATLLLVPSLATGINILVNTDYESGALAPWYQSLDYGGATNWTVTSADAHTGAYSATDQGNKLMVQYFAPVPTSDITLASVWVKNPNALFNAIYLEYSDATSVGGLFATTGQWQYVDFAPWLASGKSLIGVGIWGYSAGGTDERTYVDDWAIEAVPEPTTLGLLFCGGWVALFRRRGQRRMVGACPPLLLERCAGGRAVGTETLD